MSKTPAQVYDAVYNTLKGVPALKYINNVFKGIRENINVKSFPCIIIEPRDNGEIEQDISGLRKVWLGIDVIAYTQNLSNNDKTIVGDDNYKGVLDIENDIRGVLYASYALDCSAIDIKIDPTVFDFREYPVRGFVMPIRVLYEN